MNGEKIHLIDKNNKHVYFQICDEEESWEEVMLFDKNKKETNGLKS